MHWPRWGFGVRRSWGFGVRLKTLSERPFDATRQRFEKHLDTILAHLRPQDIQSVQARASYDGPGSAQYFVRGYLWGNQYRALGPKFNLNVTFSAIDAETTLVKATVNLSVVASILLGLGSAALFWGVVILVAGVVQNSLFLGCFWFVWFFVWLWALLRATQVQLYRIARNIERWMATPGPRKMREGPKPNMWTEAVDL